MSLRLATAPLLLLGLTHFASCFGPLFGSTSAMQEQAAIESCEKCKDKLGHTLGDEWMSCVVEDLGVVREAAEQEGTRKFFPVSTDEMTRLRPGGNRYGRSDELGNILRNYSCEIPDGGSKPLRSFNWTYTPPDPCAAGNGNGSSGGTIQQKRFAYHNGFLPAGNDLRSASMTETEAQEACWKDEECAGFTFSSDEKEASERATASHRILFKKSAEGQSSADGWHTWQKLRLLDCSEGARKRRNQTFALTVNVLRESPPVFVVDDFVTDDECEHMLSDTIPKMGRSVVGGGGTSSWRQSYSVNMVPDYSYEDHLITRIARRKFAFAREVAGYDVIEGEGQEPINAVYYYHDGDQYRPHCDGECRGGRYSLGSRVASSLAYCLTAEKGGYTLFTRVGLKVVPRRRQLLFFGYFYNDSIGVGHVMDNGHTEHTGCPTRVGRKWIATMWYRQGVTKEKDWAYWSRYGREGV